MRETICQKCHAANKKEAVVCNSCGARLDHAEDTAFARLKESGFFGNLAALPFRVAKFLVKKIYWVLSIVLGIILIGGSLLLLFMFAPLSWPDYKNPPQSEITAIAAQTALSELDNQGNARLTIDAAIRLGNDFLTAKPKRQSNKPAPAPAPVSPDDWISKLKINGQFAAIKSGDEQYEFTLVGKINGKLPWRLVARFEADREKDGLFQPNGYRFGSVPLPQFVYLRLLRLIAPMINPDQQLLPWLSRIHNAKMDLRNGRNGEFFLQVEPVKKN